ncbi:Cytochrome P450 [Corchorus olitorius]|uniref:Cytochrome P450 n=1 Tax=Corchorus olitorius TaxID=93759 RepID=A0A1R3KYV6_9ROSI|nr:Cytochrome P450 [Corchorus olitorius]
MDPLLHYLITIFFTLIAHLSFIFFYQSKKLSNHTHGKRSCPPSPPQAGGALPVIGHMHLLGGQQLTHKTLGAMADKYGPVFTIRLGIGSYSVLVVNSYDMAKECFTIHDKVFSTRPGIAASKLLGYDFVMFRFTPYGPNWREIRKIATIELLSTHRINLLKHIRASETKTAIRELYKSWLDKGGAETGVLVDMKQWFGDLTHNISWRMIGGKRCFGPNADCEEKEARRCQKLVSDFAYLFGVFVLSDVIPFLGWLDFFQGYKKAMKRSAKELDILIDGWLEEHKQKRALGGGVKQEQDFMDVMLSILEDAKIHGFDADTIKKATCLNLTLAGAGGDTTMVTLTWALSLLLNNPRVLKKAQDELDMQVGKDRALEESDITNLVYLQAIVKETLRLYPPSPLIGLYAASEDCTLSTGYHISSGMRLMVNVWKIQRDERVWPDPNDFQPERFLTSSYKDMDFRGQTFELIPFGAGRRSCPGVSLALMRMVHLILGSFLHMFEVAKPSTLESINMTESARLINLKATPLEILITPRLSSKLYPV